MKAAVIGGGAWGTALAIRLHKNGHEVTLWHHDAERVEEMKHSRRNPRLPGAQLPREMEISQNPGCVAGCSMVVFATPSAVLRGVCRKIAPHLDADAVMVSVTKGIEEGTHMRMSQVVEQETGHKVVALTGPSHAEEVAVGLPTGCLAACEDKTLAEFVQEAFGCDVFRIYTSPDAVGAELGAAMKNVIALCAGVCDGLGYGDNTKAMLVTRGLTEVARLGVALGAKKETLAGLAGVGDLIVTCTSMHSRNRRAGMLIGQGKSVAEAMKAVGGVVEGYYAAKTAWELGCRAGVEMPITAAAFAVLHQGFSAKLAMEILLTRPQKAESEDAGWL